MRLLVFHRVFRCSPPQLASSPIDSLWNTDGVEHTEIAGLCVRPLPVSTRLCRASHVHVKLLIWLHWIVSPLMCTQMATITIWIGDAFQHVLNLYVNKLLIVRLRMYDDVVSVCATQLDTIKYDWCEYVFCCMLEQLKTKTHFSFFSTH